MRDRLLGAAAVAGAAVLAFLMGFPTAGWAAPMAISGSDFVARLDHARRLAEADAAAPAPPSSIGALSRCGATGAITAASTNVAGVPFKTRAICRLVSGDTELISKYV